MIRILREQWNEGRRHGFPACCVARYALDRVRPRLVTSVVPGKAGDRLSFLLSPRMVFADGMVPCEYHLARYILNGDRTGWRRKPEAGEPCCDHWRHFEAEKLVRFETFEPEDEDGVVMEGSVSVWMFGRGDDAVSISRCPWCGQEVR